jgi:hypothetical protein
MNTFLKAILALLAVIICFETFLRFNQPFNQELMDYKKVLVRHQPWANEILSNPLAPGGPTTIAYHPYYGYVNNPKLKEIDSYGFRNDFDFKKNETNIKQIGLFGGSAAFGGGLKLNETIAKQLQSLLDKKFPGLFRVVNFNGPAMKLPQTAIIFMRELEYLDAAIFFTGFPEISSPQRFFPADFPYFSIINLYPQYAELIGSKTAVAAIRNLHQAYASFPVNNKISNSSFLLFFYKRYIEKMKKRIQTISKEAEESDSIKKLPDYIEPQSSEVRLSNSLKNYKKYSLSVESIAEKFNIKLLHVLGPMINPSDGFTGMRHLFNRMLKNPEEHYKSNSLDLTDLFPAPPNNDFKKSKFMKDTVHPKRIGAKLIAKKMLEKMISVGWFLKFRSSKE